MIVMKLDLTIFKGEMAELSDPNVIIGDLAASLQKHEAAIEAIKDVPNILTELPRKVGVKPSVLENKGQSSLGLSDDEELNLDEDANNIINSGEFNLHQSTVKLVMSIVVQYKLLFR